MEFGAIRAFFMWCTIINGGLLVLSSLILAGAGNWVYQIHSKCFSMTRETFNVAIYCFLGFFKIVVGVFNLVPYIARVIIG